jgi:TP901 family phage tail tape measure protein
MNLIKMIIDQCNEVGRVYTTNNAQNVDEFSLVYNNTTKQILNELERKLSIGNRADLDLLIDVTSRLRKAAVKLFEQESARNGKSRPENEFPTSQKSHLEKVAAKLSKQVIELETMARIVKQSNNLLNKQAQQLSSENAHRRQRGEQPIKPIMSRSRTETIRAGFNSAPIDNDIFEVGIEVDQDKLGYYAPAVEGKYVGDRIILNPLTFLSKQNIVAGKSRPAASGTHETFHRFQDIVAGSNLKESFHLTDAQMFQNPKLGDTALPNGMPQWWLDEVVKPVLKERTNVLKNYESMMNKFGVFNAASTNEKFVQYLAHPDEILAREYANYVATLDIKVVNGKTIITGGTTKYAGSKIAFENLRRRGILTDHDLLTSVGLERISDDEYAKMLMELGSIDESNGTFVFKPHYAGSDLRGDILPDRDIGVYNKIITMPKNKKPSKAQIQREIDEMYAAYEQNLKVDMALADDISDFSAKELQNLVNAPKAARKKKGSSGMQLPNTAAIKEKLESGGIYNGVYDPKRDPEVQVLSNKPVMQLPPTKRTLDAEIFDNETSMWAEQIKKKSGRDDYDAQREKELAAKQKELDKANKALKKKEIKSRERILGSVEVAPGVRAAFAGILPPGGGGGGGSNPPDDPTDEITPEPKKPKRGTSNTINLSGTPPGPSKKEPAIPAATGKQTLAQLQKTISAGAYAGLVEGIGPDIMATVKPNQKAFKTTLNQTVQGLEGLFTVVTASINDINGALKKTTIAVSNTTGIDYNEAQMNEAAAIDKENKRKARIEQRQDESEQARIRKAAKAGEEITVNKESFMRNPANANMLAELAKKNPELLNNPNVGFQYTQRSQKGAGILRAVEYNDINAPGKQVIREAKVMQNDNGRVWTQNAKGLQTFTQQLGHNIKELAMWSIGMGLIYGPLTKMNELVQTAITNQSLLAKVTITLGEAQSATGKIFDNSAKIARETGVAIDGVIAGYNTAFRATGDIADRTERYATANQLLTDSILLSKLSTLDQATATDTLVAALSQLNMPLDQGQVLLDKWVKVSRVANVDVTTLATSFAIVGEAAMNAGLSVDELNGLIAVIASTGVTNAKETGNAARAIISGATNETTSKKLGQYGISTADPNGKARDFMKIVGDINEKYGKGLITDDQLNSIALVIAQGNRRQAQTVIALSKLTDIQNIASQSGGAKGDAQKALAIEMSTVQTATTNLNNAFVELAQALGGEGGILSTATGVLNIFTKLVDVLGDVTSSIGTATPAIIAMGAAMAMTKGSDTFGSMLGGGQRTPGNATGFFSKIVGPSGKMTLGDKISEKWNNPAIRGKALAAGGALMAGGMQMAQGETVGGAITMAAGGLTSLINPVLGMITTTIVSAFVAGAHKAGQELENIGFTKGEVDENGNPIEPGLTKGEKQARAIGGGDNAWGQFWGKLQVGLVQAADKYAPFSKEDTERSKTMEAAGYAAQIARAKVSAGTMTQAQYEEIFAPDIQEEKDKIIRAQRKAESRRTQVADAPLIEAGKKQIYDYIQENAYGTKPNLSVTEARAITQRAPGFGSWSETALQPFQGNFGAITQGGRGGAYKYMADIYTTANQDQIDMISNMVVEISDLQAAIEEANKGGFAKLQEGEQDKNGKYTTGRTIAEAQADLLRLQGQYAPTVQQIHQQGVLNNVSMPGVVDLSNVSSDKIKGIEDGVNAYLDLVAGAMDEGEKEFDKKRRETAEAIGKFSDGYKRLAVDPGDLAAAQEAGFVEKGVGKTPGFQQYEATQAQLLQAMKQGKVLENEAVKRGYKATYEQQIANTTEDKKFTDINKPGMSDDLKIDLQFLQIALQDILEVEKKQLEGIYNLPEGMAFWIPSTAAYLQPKGGTTDTSSTNNSLVSATGATQEELAKAKIAVDIATKASPVTTGMLGRTPAQVLAGYQTNPLSTAATAAARGSLLNPGNNVTLLNNTPASSWADFRRFDNAQMQNGGSAGLTVPPVNTRLNVTSTTNVTLLIDSRVLANIIKKTQADDMVRFSTSSPLASTNLIGAV